MDFGRFVEHHANYYDLNWNLLDIGETDYPPIPEHIEEKPQNFDEMVVIAGKSSAGTPFLRVDLYNINGKIYFGETTFFPSSGMCPFEPDSADFPLGKLIILL
jgi:hypothetical protein